jgi:hypothetical protein
MNNNKNLLYYCRICGLRQINPPWGDDNKSPSFEICPCCNVEFGYEDCNLDTIRSFRTRWMQDGALWSDLKTKPLNWSLKEQMKNIPTNYL